VTDFVHQNKHRQHDQEIQDRHRGARNIRNIHLRAPSRTISSIVVDLDHKAIIDGKLFSDEWPRQLRPARKAAQRVQPRPLAAAGIMPFDRHRAR
jgi:hypothetical protein